MSYKTKKIFEELNKKLLIELHNKERGISVFDWVNKLQYYGKGLFTEDMVQKSKLIDEHNHFIVRKERFLQNIRR